MNWLTLLFIVKLCQPCFCASGLYWDKYRQEFIPILSIPEFARVHDEAQRKIRQSRESKFDGRVVAIKLFDYKNVLEFDDNDTKISGPVAEVWYCLSEYLNFTIRPVSGNPFDPSPAFHIQSPLDIAPYMICNNDTQSLLDCTMPMFRKNVRLYTRPIMRSDKFWIFKMFQPTTLLITVAMFFLFSVAGIVAQEVYNRWNAKKINLSLSDRIFYVSSSFMAQGWQPSQLEQESKILVYINKLFGWYLIFLLGCVFLDFLISATLELPFANLKSLLENTKYHVLICEWSASSEQYLEEYEKRITTLYSIEEMFPYICSSDGQYAAIAEEQSNNYANAPCAIVPVGEIVDRYWVSGGIVKGSPYLNALNKGILRLLENGVIKRFINSLQLLQHENDVFACESIDFEHVYMIYVLLGSGTIIAIICFICEHIVFWYQQNRKNKPSRLNKRKRQRVRQY